MHYFVTATLSPHEITLKYYRDDDGLNILIPFQGVSWPAPLAVHINDSDIIVGKDALQRFEVSQPNTFYNLFSLIDSGDTYKRMGLHKSTSHLIYLTVEALLAPLMQSQLNLNLDDVRATLPLGFNFTPDVDHAHRKTVLDLFRNGDGTDCGGYSNIGEIDADAQLARLALHNNHRNYALVLHTSQQNLAVTLYSKADPDRCLGSTVMKDLGIDRRIMNGVKEIKAYVRDKNPNIDFSPIEERLEKIVEEFIASGKMETNSKVLINGEPYRYSLSTDDLRSNAAATERQFIAQHISQFLHNNSVHPDDTVMVLASPRLQNDYFLPLFREHFESVYCVTPQQTEQMQQQIIDSIVGSGYNFSPEVRLYHSLEQKWTDIRTFVKNVLLPANKTDEAREDIADFIQTVRNSALSPDQQENLIAKARELQNGIKDVVVPPPFDYLEQLVDSVTEEINEFIHYNDPSSAQKSYDDLELEIKRAGQLQKYASKLEDLKMLFKPVKTAPPVNDPLSEAIRNRDFRQARKICRQTDDFNSYQTMKELEDAHKKYLVAEKYVNQYLAEQNKVAIERAIREISEYQRLLDSVSAPHPEVDSLLKRFMNAK